MSQLGDRNLLFGILALEDYLISRDALIAAMKAWVADKTKGMGQILREQNALSENNQAVVEERVHSFLVKHDHDVPRCLADVKLPNSVKRDLEKIGDADLSASLERVGAPVVIAPVVVAPTPRTEAPILVAPTPREKAAPAPIMVKPVAKPRPKTPAPVAHERSGPGWGLLLFGGAFVFALVFLVLVGGAVGFILYKHQNSGPHVDNKDKLAKDDKPNKDDDKPGKDKPPIDVPPPALSNRKPTEIIGEAVWRVDGEELVATNVPTKRAYLFFGSKDWTDYDFTFETKTESGRTGTLALFRADGEQNHYGLSLGSFLSGKHSLSRVSKGLVVYDVPHVATKYNLNQWYKVKIEVRGDKIRCHIDDEQVFDYKNDAFTRGQVALGTTSDSRARWKNIQVATPGGKLLWDGLPELSASVAPPTTTPGFVSLFNGKDLTGWKNPTLSGEWRVQDGVLIGVAPGNRISRLHTAGKYKDFHLRTEIRVHDQSSSQVAIRSEDGRYYGYNASIRSLVPTNALVGILNANTGKKSFTLQRLSPEMPMPTGQWFPLEIIAEGNRLTLLVDGKKTTETSDDSIPDAGYIYLAAGGNGNVEFRKLEIKELNAVAVPPVVAPADGFVQLFNGKDLTGWSEEQDGAGTWRVLNGHLTSGGAARRPAKLFTSAPLPKDFHLRMELRSDRSEGNFLLRANADHTIAYDTSFTYTGPNGTLRAGNLFYNDVGRQFQFKAPAVTQVNKGDWFTAEYIFDGNKLVTKINGNTIADVTNANQPNAGHLVIRPWSMFPIEFKKIEVKALNAGQVVGVPPVVLPPVVPAEGFTALFNGKDLTGWVKDKFAPELWRVDNGLLQRGNLGGNPVAKLASEIDQPKDFHLRIEGRFNAPQGNFMLFVRSPDGMPRGYHTTLSHGINGLFGGGILASFPGSSKMVAPPKQLAAPIDGWFRLEVLAEGKRVVVKVDGKTISDITDEGSTAAGKIVFLESGPPSIQIQRIEIKALNPGALPAPVAPAPLDGKDFVKLFNGKDLTGWKQHPQLQGNWRIVDGILIGTADKPPGRLDSDKPMPRDFHLRVVARVNDKGTASICFRCPEGSLVGYEAPINSTQPFIAKSGSLYAQVPGRRIDLALLKQTPVAPGEWFTLEIIAEGSHLMIKVNGETTVNTLDSNKLTPGHVAIMCNPQTTIEFRSIEIKGLRPD